ncbi:MAG: hypothetical protein Q9164_006261 [Protoblastenia rupestris]
MAELTIRPAPNSVQKSNTNLFRAYVAPAYLIRFNLREGDVHMLRAQNIAVGTAVVVKSPDKDLRSSVIQITQFLQTCYSLKLGDKVSIDSTQVTLPFASLVSVVRIGEDNQTQPTMEAQVEDSLHWAWILKLLFRETKFVIPGAEFENVVVFDEKRAYKIVDVDSSQKVDLYRMQSECHVQIVEPNYPIGERAVIQRTLLPIAKHDVGGLEDQLKQLDELMSEYNTDGPSYEWLDGAPSRERGILLYGLSGTGKSLLLKKIADTGWSAVFYLDSKVTGRTSLSDKAAAIKTIFTDALRSQPSVIIVDDLDSFAGRQIREETGDINPTSTLLCQQLDQLHDARVLLIGATQALKDIDQNLRHLNRFSIEIEIPVPDSKARAQTLKIISGISKEVEDHRLESIALRTHGFVGADLKRLHRIAGKKAKGRIEASLLDALADSDPSRSKIQIERAEEDYLNALQYVRPTAMREIFVETPEVRWVDIAGQEKVKEYLEEAIIWPFKACVLHEMDDGISSQVLVF